VAAGIPQYIYVLLSSRTLLASLLPQVQLLSSLIWSYVNVQLHCYNTAVAMINCQVICHSLYMLI